jgi:1,4-dihydroxy-6-naphthoate synthase
MTLTFGFSPCPNDTFMFEAIVNQKIDLRGITFNIMLDDVEHLNKTALNHIPDVTKLSFNAYTKLYDRYQLLNSGSALGNHCGPLLISKKPYEAKDVNKLTIAVPGYNTTAFLLLKYAFPDTTTFKEYVFSEIENAVLTGQADAGVIIHENRFTYGQKGLFKIMDLGENWEAKTGSPIPLGGIAIKRSLPESIKIKVNDILFDSIKYAFEHPQESLPYISLHAQEMDTEVMQSHIRLYVNQYSQDIGLAGKHAVNTLFRIVHPDITEDKLNDLFVK